MFVTILLTLLIVVNALTPESQFEADKKSIMAKYVSKIPDIKNKYIIDYDLSKALSKLFKGKISMFPLYKVNVTINRTPVKIPWSMTELSEEKTKPSNKQRQYRFMPASNLQ